MSDVPPRATGAMRRARGAAGCAALALLGACGPGSPDAPGETMDAGAATADVAFDNHPGLQEFLNAPGFRFETLSGGPIRMHFQPGSYAALLAPDFQDGAEGILGEVQATLDAGPTERGVDVFVLDSQERMRALTGRSDVAWFSEELGAVFLVFSESDRPLLRRTLAPLMAARLWGSGDPWLETGFGLWFDGECVGVERPLEVLPAQLAAAGRRVPVRQLVEAWSEAEVADPFATELSAAGLTHFVVERYGMDALATLWREGSGAVLRVTGADLDDLDGAWANALPPVPPDAVPLATVEAEGGCR